MPAQRVLAPRSARPALLPALLPGLVAAAIGYLIFVGLGDFAGLGTPGLVVPDLPNYSAERLSDLLVGIVVGVLDGAGTYRVPSDDSTNSGSYTVVT